MIIRGFESRTGHQNRQFFSEKTLKTAGFFAPNYINVKKLGKKTGKVTINSVFYLLKEGIRLKGQYKRFPKPQGNAQQTLSERVR